MAAPPDPANPLPPRRPAPPSRPVPPPRRDYAAEEDAGRRLTNANLQLRRGQIAEAEAGVRALLAERPQDAGAHELLGDVLAERGDWDGAGAAYQAALQQEPGRASAEAKFGKAALRRAEQARRETLGVAYAADETAMVGREGGAGAAWPTVLGSALCPGLGQVVQGQTLKGVILIGIFLLGLGLLAVLPRGVDGRSYFSPGFWLVAALLVADWIYAVADAAQAAARPKS